MNCMIKRLVLVMLSVLLFLLTACGSVTSPFVADRGNNTFVPSGEKIESSIFGRNIEYDGWSVNGNVTMPIEPSEILEAFQIGKIFYFHSVDGVYTMNIETGENVKLINSAVDMLTYYGESLFTYTVNDGKLCTYSLSGELEDEQTVIAESDNIKAEEFFITEDYYVFVVLDNSEFMPFTHYDAYDRKTLELVTSFRENGASVSIRRMFSIYKGNIFLKSEKDGYTDNFDNITAIDLDTGKTKMVAHVYNKKGCYSDFVYNPKTDTILLITGPAKATLNMSDGSVKVADKYPLCITEYSLNDPDNIVHKRFYIEIENGTEYYVGVHENIVTAVCTAGDEIMTFDYLNPPESITFVTGQEEYYKDYIYGFEKETGILVKTVNYGYDYQRLDMKLMAGDTDFDVFIPIYMHMHKYFLSHMYGDLAKYDELKSRLDSDVAANFVSKLGDTYVGMPMGINEYFPKDKRFDNKESFAPSYYSHNASKVLYCAKYIDLTTGTHLDPEGKELYKILKFLHDYPDGNVDKMPIPNEYNMLSAEFAVLNPNGKNIQNAIRFLAYIFDVNNGDIEGVIPPEEQYMNLESTENTFATWHSQGFGYIMPILDACKEAINSDGKASTLKDLAREATMEVRMRMSE